MASSTDSRRLFLDGIADFRQAWSMRSGWSSLAQQDLVSSYRRTVIGPFWISIQQLSFVFGIGLLYTTLFKVDARDHVPLVAFGILIFGLWTRLISGATSTFISAGPSVKSSTLPMSFHVFHGVANEFLVFIHIAIVTAIVPVLYGCSPSYWSIIVTPVGVFLVLLNGVSFGLWLGPLSARFRDIQVGIGAILQLGLFVTPVFWDAERLGRHHWAIVYNPFAWVVLTIRGPLLGSSVDWALALSLICFSCLNFIVGVIVFSRARPWIAYVL